jgi:membrane-bound serine protease (ClpP class)
MELWRVNLARAALFAAVLAVALAAFLPPARAVETGKFALEIDIDGPIGPAIARHVKDALTTAGERRAEVVILRMNTPGGLVTSMREIITDVLASPVPVIGYVAPSGAHAASAGTYILYATHVAAMAPGTNIGAATPIEIGGPTPGSPDGTNRDEVNDGKDGKDVAAPPTSTDAITAKMTNDAVAFIRSLAELRGRNADWAEKAVREAASLSASAALAAGVVDLIARDQAELLQRIDGRNVEMAGSAMRKLSTKGLLVETLQPGWLIRVLSVVTDPNVAFILMTIGIYGLIFEFTSPGAVAPGIIGTISLLLGLYALNLLPIDYTGLALMMFGIIFLIVEAFNPTVVLGLGGLVAFLLGAAMLMKVQAPGFQLSWTIIGLVAAVTFALSTLAARSLWITRKNPTLVGAQAMHGLPAEIIDWHGDSGHVFAQGERWQARGEGDFIAGEIVEVTAVKDLTLVVRRRPGRPESDGGRP